MEFIRSEFYVSSYNDGIMMFYVNPYGEGVSLISLYFSPNVLPDYFMLGVLETSTLEMDYVYALVNEFVNTASCQNQINEIKNSATKISIGYDNISSGDYRSGKNSYLN